MIKFLKLFFAKYLEWRKINASLDLNRRLHYQGGFVSWIPAIATVGSALLGSNASSNAAQTQANAGALASQQQMDMFNIINAQQAPYRQAGQNALSQLGQMTGPGGSFVTPFTAADLQSNLAPNYQFQLGQGLGAVNNQVNSTGGLVSGNSLKAINDYAQNFAGNAYQQAFNNYNAQQSNIFNRLSSIAGLGQTSNQTTAAAGQNAAGLAGQFGTSAAAAQAAGQIGQANAISSGLQGLGGLYAGGMLPSFSDRRAKENIIKIGETVYGLGLYVFNYVFDKSHKQWCGVMADEVEKIMPCAVIKGKGSEYDRVCYDMLGIEMVEI